MYLYFGRVGGNYAWGFLAGDVVYFYEQGPSTKWRTVYRGRVGIAELITRLGRAVVEGALVKAVARHLRRLPTAALISALSPTARELLGELTARGLKTISGRYLQYIREQIGDILKALGLDDDG
ncbi:MAG: hypothetical protein C0167_03645 [Nitrososphaera sp.]|nr:MAG: hypothetical protein C0167_03645 [Nitrososphaera sp.]